jgi:transglutaminase-like putative cysteine protease
MSAAQTTIRPHSRSPADHAEEASTPPLLRHVAACVFVAVAVGWSAGHLVPAPWRYPMLAGLVAVFTAAYLLGEYRRIERMVSHALSVAVVAGAATLCYSQGLPPVRAAEIALLGLLLAQAVGADRPMHYCVLGALALFLLVANVRHAGYAPHGVVVPAVLSGTLLLADAGGDETGDRPGLLTRLPLRMVVLSCMVAVGAALMGGRVISSHLPVIQGEDGQMQTNLWVGFLRQQLSLGRAQSPERNFGGSVPGTEKDFLRKHYASKALLDLTRTDSGSLTEKLLLTVDSDRPVYMKGAALDSYTGGGWEPSERLKYERAIRPEFTARVIGLGRGPRSGQSRLWKVRIWVQRDLGRIVHVPVSATSLLAEDLDLVLRDQWGNLYAGGRIGAGTKYSAAVMHRKVRHLVGAPMGGDPERIRETYLQLPLLPDRLIQRSNRVVTEAEDRLRAVRELTRMVKRRKSYTKAAQRIPADRDAVDYFLFEMEEGSCSHFASALAVACRIVGIPARVVTGFGPGTYNASSMTWRIREKDSHAWTQVWFPDYGWANFDPTPSRYSGLRGAKPHERRSVGETVGHWTAKLRRAWENLEAIWGRAVVYARGHWAWTLYGLGGLVAMVPVLLVLRWIGVRLLWWGRWHFAFGRDGREEAELIYRCALEWLRRRGVSVEPFMTPDEIVEEVKGRGYPWSDDFAEFSRAAQRIVFGAPGVGEEELASLRGRAGELKGRLAEKPPRQ